MKAEAEAVFDLVFILKCLQLKQKISAGSMIRYRGQLEYVHRTSARCNVILLGGGPTQNPTDITVPQRCHLGTREFIAAIPNNASHYHY